jgi:hypothetical protein
MDTNKLKEDAITVSVKTTTAPKSDVGSAD